MAPTRDEFEEAVASFWDVRQSQALSSRLAGVVGAGNAGSVRGAGHFHAVAAVVARFFMDAGYPAESVRVTGRQGLALPGYFRPQKLWDVVVAHRGTLVAALELTALCGPSFGNNYNNRVEEALGSAIDVHHAQLAKLYPGEKPWLGYFFLLEDTDRSRQPVTIAPGVFDIDPTWRGRSCQQRVELFCSRLLDERLYDAVCYVTSSPAEPRPREPADALNWQRFAAAINARISYLKELGFPG